MMAEGLKALLSDEFELTGIVEDGRAMIQPKASGLAPVDVIHDRYHSQLARSPTGKGRRKSKRAWSARSITGLPPGTRSELESVRRTLRNLRKQGRVVVEVRYPARVYYARPRDGLEGVVAFEAVGFLRAMRRL